MRGSGVDVHLNGENPRRPGSGCGVRRQNTKQDAWILDAQPTVQRTQNPTHTHDHGDTRSHPAYQSKAHKT